MARQLSKMIMILVTVGVMAGCGKVTPKHVRASHAETSKSKQNVQSPAIDSPDQNRFNQPERQGAQSIPMVMDFNLKDQTGKDVRLSDYAGKIVVLEWFNPQCPFCQAHYTSGAMVALAKQYAEKGVVWLGINSTNTATVESNKAFSDAHSVPYPLLDDHAGLVGHLFGAKTTPHMFVLDAKRQVVYQGAIDNAPMGKVPDGKTRVNYVDQALSEILKGLPVTTTQTDSYGCSVKY